MMLQIQHLTKVFGGVQAVRDCSFEIEKGKITALIGPNGSGKTTIFNLISGIIKPDQGTILFLEKDITHFSVDHISNLGISRVFQQSRLFKNHSAEENLFIALDNEDTKFWRNIFGFNAITRKKGKKVHDVLDVFGLLGVAHHQASDLSFGQKRLVELARTAVNPHSLLLLDEPVAGVNPKIKNDIARMLLTLKKKGETVLLIEHDMSFTLGIADRVIVLDAGSVIAHGAPNEIKHDKKVLEAYLGV